MPRPAESTRRSYTPRAAYPTIRPNPAQPSEYRELSRSVRRPTGVTRLWLVPSLALIIVASGCLGGSAAGPVSNSGPSAVSPTVSGLSHAQFQIRGTYLTGNSPNYAADLHRLHFAITCLPKRTYEQLKGPLSWKDKLCLAILDYPTQIRLLGIACNCPVSLVGVDVRGEIHGRRVHERITPCLCGDGAQAAHDAHVILKTHPPVF
jgi:hypothetical protein